MFGREREQAGLLVEPYSEHAVDPADETALAEFRNKIWCAARLLMSRMQLTPGRPAVEEANRPAPAFARIFKEMILVTSPEKPLPRAGKGTIIRKQATQLYAEEINKL